MNKLKLIWSAIRPQPKRKISLVHVYTFKTGERLYTYQAKDYGKISARYNRNIQEATNYLQTFALTASEWKAAVHGVKDLIRQSLNGKLDSTDVLMDINSTFDWFINKTEGLKNANETILEFMYCMFYVLEDEQETGYNEEYNKRKIDLLNAEPEMRDFFLDSLKQNTKDYLPISRNDTLMLLLEMMKVKGALTFMNMPESMTP